MPFQTDQYSFEATQPSLPRKLQIDASYKDGFGGAGYVVTDHTGVPVASDHEMLGHMDGSQQCEVEAVRRGVERFTTSAVNHLIVVTDSTECITANHLDWDQWDEYYQSLKATWVPRSENHVADKLAKLAVATKPDGH